MAKQQFVIGLDGGGTKTAAVLADINGNVLAEETGGPSNFQIIGVEKAAETILGLIERCCKQHGCSSGDVASVTVGLTGAGRPGDQRRMWEGLIGAAERRNVSLNTVVIESDARIALEGAFKGKVGIILIAGTGSIAFGKDMEGNVHRAGGWGRTLGDEGSGYKIGRDGLNAVTRHLDERLKETLLTKLVARDFGLSSQEKIITAVYRENFDVASIAPLVIEAAEQKDPEAARILNRATFELSEHVRALLLKIERVSRARRKVPLAFIGSVITSESVLTKILRHKITFSLPQISIVQPAASPAYGAVLLAIRSVTRTP
ncbi:MAG: BadF/BadG/BcrA/BcrD ATPase family protein [Bacteroidota bacterium]